MRRPVSALGIWLAAASAASRRRAFRFPAQRRRSIFRCSTGSTQLTGDVIACQFAHNPGKPDVGPAAYGVTACYRGGDGAVSQPPGDYGLVASRHEQEGGVFRVDRRSGAISICYLYFQREKQGDRRDGGGPIRRLHDAVQVNLASAHELYASRIELRALEGKPHGAVHLHHRRRGLLARQGSGFGGARRAAAGARLHRPAAQARPLSQRRSGHDEPDSARRGVRHRRRRRDRPRPRPLRALHRRSANRQRQHHHRPHLSGPSSRRSGAATTSAPPCR